MSLLTVCRCNIANVTESVLKKAMENIAKKYDSRLLTEVQDYYKRTHSVVGGLHAEGLRYPLGVRLNDGEVEFVYDAHGSSSHVIGKIKKEIQAEIKKVQSQEVKAAICRALKKAGFAVDLERKSATKLLIKGVK